MIPVLACALLIGAGVAWHSGGTTSRVRGVVSDSPIEVESTSPRRGWLDVLGPLGRRLLTERRRLTLDAALPETIDILAVVIGSGGTVSESLRVLARRGPAAIRNAAATAVEQRAGGLDVTRTLDRLVTELGESYRPVLASLAAAERDGAPASLVLGRLADEARAARRRQAEAQARRLPVRLIFPLVCCSLPAVVVGAVVPLLIVSLGRLW